MRKALFIVTMCSGWSMAVCPQFTYPENHKIDVELNNICTNVRYPSIDYGTANTMVITSATLTTAIVSTMTITSFTVTNETAQNATVAKLTVTTMTVTSSATITNLTVNGSTAIITSTLALTSPLYAYVVIPSSNPSPTFANFVNCLATATITNPASVNIPFELSAFYDFGNQGCANAGTGGIWILEDGAFIGSESVSVPRYKNLTLGSSVVTTAFNDILTGITPGTHNFCIGFAVLISGCGSFWVNEFMTNSAFIVKAVQ